MKDLESVPVSDLLRAAAARMRASKRGEVQAHVKLEGGWAEFTLPEHRPSPPSPPFSVQPKWRLALPLQMQSVLLLAARGPDGFSKYHPCKPIVRAYRGTVFLAAKYGRALRWGEAADNFMGLDVFADEEKWELAIGDFLRSVDQLPHHYLLHLAHGAEILGYKHPDPAFRARWFRFYEMKVKSMHLSPESEVTMNTRLGDWDRKHWDVKE